MKPIMLKLEAVLFSSGKKMAVGELAALVGSKKGTVLRSLKELQQMYKENGSSMIILNEGELWKITVREEFMPLVRSIVTETELPRSVLETLAVIAWKAPILQSDVIKIRNNKAYDHIAALEASDFILKERYGRSYKLKLTQKFSEYFDLDDIKRLQQRLEPQKKSTHSQ